MAASISRCALQKGKHLIRSNIRETYCKQKRWLKFRPEDEQYVPKVVPYKTFPEMSLEERYPEVEISAEDFKYVERLFPAKTVPKPPEHESYPTPSGWFPPDKRLEGSDHPYFVKRSKNHMLPVYLAVHKISKQKTTVIKHIIGDIWKLDEEIKAHLLEKICKPVDSQVHEVAMYLRYRGNYTDIIAPFLLDKGF